jgi:uncharacterized HAD superfamily protein
MSITFTTYQQLFDDVLRLRPQLPPDVVAVIGVPRSGMIPATMLATEMHVPLGATGSDTVYGGSRIEGAPCRKINDLGPGTVVIIDDSVNGGRTMAAARKRSAELIRRHNIICASVYIRRRSNAPVDFYGRSIRGARLFEWNLFNHRHLSRAMVDMDGVLCRDPRVTDDDSEGYQRALDHAFPLHVPSVPVRAIVTCRLERWRTVTQRWLEINGIRYGQLIMSPCRTAAQRRKAGDYGGYKAKHYIRSNARLFIESSDRQARRIAAVSGRPVLSLESKVIY